MVQLNFRMSGSKGAVYAITFEIIDGNIISSCRCGSSIHGNFCKHRKSLLDGEIENLISENTEDVKTLNELIQGTELKLAYDQEIIATKNFDNLEKFYISEKLKLDLVKTRLNRFSRQ